mmetsp:Transcript_74574/g.189234  ORF Transcript_74574/g.189234 Transcript_74574/m.189234 type:complete len:601 (-) Transcript_74574:776-2578(-)
MPIATDIQVAAIVQQLADGPAIMTPILLSLDLLIGFQARVRLRQVQLRAAPIEDVQPGNAPLPGTPGQNLPRRPRAAIEAEHDRRSDPLLWGLDFSHSLDEGSELLDGAEQHQLLRLHTRQQPRLRIRQGIPRRRTGGCVAATSFCLWDLVQIQEVAHELARRHPLQVEALDLRGRDGGRLQQLLLREELLEGVQRLRRAVEALEAEALASRIRHGIDGVGLHPCRQCGLALPTSHRGHLPDLDVQHSARMVAIPTIPQEHHVDGLGLFASLHLARAATDAFVRRHPLQHIPTLSALQGLRHLVEGDLVLGPGQVLADPIVAAQLRLRIRRALSVRRLEEGRGAARAAQGGHRGHEGLGAEGRDDALLGDAPDLDADEGAEAGGVAVRRHRVDLLVYADRRRLEDVCGNLLPTVGHQHVHHADEVRHFLNGVLGHAVGLGALDATHELGKPRGRQVPLELAAISADGHHQGVVHDPLLLEELRVRGDGAVDARGGVVVEVRRGLGEVVVLQALAWLGVHPTVLCRALQVVHHIHVGGPLEDVVHDDELRRDAVIVQRKDAEVPCQHGVWVGCQVRGVLGQHAHERRDLCIGNGLQHELPV